ncbi:hypothetical protein L1987_28090 [Smallanthus sonchifolius]|uniref:Uncharacterized protein n=1 Tax=Smallanthus sonchifolius TaxID=185202 RepID=A0ACB9IDF8_9ASTR|nr:hypothetical protein L1987_28090 [Smallanthus sonchifolius]
MVSSYETMIAPSYGPGAPTTGDAATRLLKSLESLKHLIFEIFAAEDDLKRQKEESDQLDHTGRASSDTGRVRCANNLPIQEPASDQVKEKIDMPRAPEKHSPCLADLTVTSFISDKIDRTPPSKEADRTPPPSTTTDKINVEHQEISQHQM